jgi:hypothetical protein
MACLTLSNRDMISGFSLLDTLVLFVLWSLALCAPLKTGSDTRIHFKDGTSKGCLVDSESLAVVELIATMKFCCGRTTAYTNWGVCVGGCSCCG